MKFLERLALTLFSIIILILAVTSCLVIFDIIELKAIYKFIEELISNDTASKIILGGAIVEILLAVKALFFPYRIKKKAETKTGVLLENKDGRLLISKDTIENLINSVVKSFNQAIDAQTKINLDTENDITVYISLLVKEDSVINELSSNIQNKIKETIKRNTGLEVNQVNINVKDIDNSNDKKGNVQTRIDANNIQINQNQTREKFNTDLQELDKNTIEQNTIEQNTIESNAAEQNMESSIVE